MAGWAAYANHRDIFKATLPSTWRDRCTTLLCCQLWHDAETWTLTKQAQNKLAAAQTKMERSMLNITYKDRKTNIWVRERTNVIDIIYTVWKMKWSWAGHINRLKVDRWTSRVTTCETIWQGTTTRETSQAVERRPGQIWSGTIWQRTAQDRVIWRRHAEAFAQPRDTTAA